MTLLECKNLSVGYSSKIVLKNLNFSVRAGDYICVVGENGSGKTTLMKTMLSLQNPIFGEVKFSENLSKNEIGYLPQQTQSQKDFPASVKEIVLSGCNNADKLKPFYSKSDKQKARLNMEKMGILDIKNACYRELSGGQQQRVLLARALCATSKMLLLDEPVSGLDIKAANEMYSIIENLNKNENITVIMISHDIEAALKYSTKILHIGKNIFFGTAEEYINSKLFLNNKKEGKQP
ncbi:MAG: metal ABC transporter ATP-binding protein [Acutalibacteraceae bacterium]|nr:metal ABC transporter ATP-binding protein [Acutalibacteraceae bacterium]